MTGSIQTYSSFRERMGGIRVTVFGFLAQLTRGAFITLIGAKRTSDCLQHLVRKFVQKLAWECLRCAQTWSVLRVAKEGLLGSDFTTLISTAKFPCLHIDCDRRVTKISSPKRRRQRIRRKVYVRLILCHEAAIWRQNNCFWSTKLFCDQTRRSWDFLNEIWHLLLFCYCLQKFVDVLKAQI